jgi:hypothetical protein
MAHGWLSKDRLRVVGGQVTVDGWAESAIAHTRQQWPRWEKGHAMRKPEGRATQQDDAFALAVVLLNLLRGHPVKPFARSDGGVVDNQFVEIPDFAELEFPSNPGEKLGPVMKKLLQEPESPQRLRDELQPWLGRRPVIQVSDVGPTHLFRLSATGSADWSQADLQLEVEVDSAGQRRTYSTVLPKESWRMAHHLVTAPKVFGNDDRTRLGEDLAAALLGAAGTAMRRVLVENTSPNVVPRVVIQATAALQHIPWEMAAVKEQQSLASTASVVRRLVEHPQRLPDLGSQEQHLVVGRPAMVVPDKIAVPTISRNWKDFTRHRGTEPIFHFIGEGEPGKLFCGEDAIDPNLLGDLLYRAHTRLALLTACNSNVRGDDGISTAVHLSEAGVPAVIGMSGQVEVGATIDLAAAFLHQLTETGDVELSLFNARRTTTQINRVQDHPVLFLTTEDGVLFHPAEE